VGTAARLEHRRPSPLGAELVVEAELTEIDGARLVFLFIARESDSPGGEVLGAGTMQRVVLDREHFLARLTGPS